MSRGRKIHVAYHRSARHFDQFSEARQKGFLTVMDLKEQGIPLVEPIAPSCRRRSRWRQVRWWSRCAQRPDETIEEAERSAAQPLPLIKSSYGFSKTDKCPYFYFSDLVVGETTCDGKKKMVRIHGGVQSRSRHAVAKQQPGCRLTRAVESRNSTKPSNT